MGHVPRRADCDVCQEALGLRRRHRQIPVDARSTAVLSLDLTGPHHRAFETAAQYALIAVATFEKGLNLVYGVPVVDKTSAKTLQATLACAQRVALVARRKTPHCTGSLGLRS